MVGGMLERKVTRDDPDWAAAMASLTVRERVKIMSLRRQHKENGSCRTVFQQLVSLIPQSVLMKTSYKEKEEEVGTQKKRLPPLRNLIKNG